MNTKEFLGSFPIMASFFQNTKCNAPRTEFRVTPVTAPPEPQGEVLAESTSFLRFREFANRRTDEPKNRRTEEPESEPEPV
jgi:hypothetical protein